MVQYTGHWTGNQEFWFITSIELVDDLDKSLHLTASVSAFVKWI